ncbi:hypothetical protein [Paraburkholderia youngii]|uniref:Uncharacterized protein n=1 Tax=Paraburkholderia youngii TaxID=2782701 RepID=A0A7Y6K876_9BURK|nr:hypothetical protein [Paraburkholderia youngii]NUY06236.1 hypothetical protein [Paraburkholderia youngii]
MTYHAVDWEAAAQEAAFDGLCFCMLSDGRFINRQAMPADTPRRCRFDPPAEFLSTLAACLADLTVTD